jgi:peptide chain release factor subunit 1
VACSRRTGESLNLCAHPASIRDAVTGVELEVVDKEPVVEWFANNYKNFGCTLEFVTDRSGEGVQFVKGFGGIGGILRWKVDFVEMKNLEEAHKREVHKDDSDEEEEEKESDDGYGFDDGDFGF